MLIRIRQDNVLLDDNFHVQIADFGLTRHSDSSVTQSGAALHYNSAAPELFEDYPSDNADDAQSLDRAQKADIYAFACLYYEVSENKEVILPLNNESPRFILTLFLLRE